MKLCFVLALLSLELSTKPVAKLFPRTFSSLILRGLWAIVFAELHVFRWRSLFRLVKRFWIQECRFRSLVQLKLLKVTQNKERSNGFSHTWMLVFDRRHRGC
jgi:hypothetical protein